MNDESPDKRDKFRRYRARKKAAGLREIRMWVPDVNAPGFQERLDKQIAAINASKDSAEVQEWLDEMTEKRSGTTFLETRRHYQSRFR